VDRPRIGSYQLSEIDITPALAISLIVTVLHSSCVRVCDMQKVTPLPHEWLSKVLLVVWPFPIREGRVEAELGPDGKLFCHGTTCADDACEAASIARKRA
jgi:hypothetical protein